MSADKTLDFTAPPHNSFQPGRNRMLVRQTLTSMTSGQTLEVISKFPRMPIIMPIVCANNDATLQSQTQTGTAPELTYTFVIRKN